MTAHEQPPLDIVLPEWTDAVLRYAHRHKSLREWEHVADVIEALVAALKAKDDQITVLTNRSTGWETLAKQYEAALKAERERVDVEYKWHRVHHDALIENRTLVEQLEADLAHADTVTKEQTQIIEHIEDQLREFSKDREQLRADLTRVEADRRALINFTGLGDANERAAYIERLQARIAEHEKAINGGACFNPRHTH